MKRNHLLFVLLLVLLVTLLPSCSGKTQSEKLTKLELEFTGNTTTDDYGTAVFAERSYSKGKEILGTRKIKHN